MPTETFYSGPTSWVSFRDGHTVGYGSGGGGGGDPTWNNGNGPIFGFNVMPEGATGYNPSGESVAAAYTRLHSAFGDYRLGKSFPNGIPASYANVPQHPSVTYHIICCDWTLGSIASGSHDTDLDNLFSSVPSGITLIFSRNEVNLTSTSGIAQGSADMTNYIADMDHVYNYIAAHQSGWSGTVWVADCFGGSSFISGTTDITVWIPTGSRTKRHCVIIDVYENQYQVDKTGQTRYGAVITAAASVGLKLFVGETGDRRPSTLTAGSGGDAPDYGGYYLAPPVQNAATVSSTGGSLAAGTYRAKITLINSIGETVASNEISATTTGSTSKITWNWTQAYGATGYKIYTTVVNGIAGSEALVATVGTVGSYTQTSGSPGSGFPPSTNTAAENTDAFRAARWTTRFNNLWQMGGTNLLGVCYFNREGTTGDHRILSSGMSDDGPVNGPDTATIAAIAAFAARARGQ